MGFTPPLYVPGPRGKREWAERATPNAVERAPASAMSSRMLLSIEARRGLGAVHSARRGRRLAALRAAHRVKRKGRMAQIGGLAERRRFF